MIDVLVALSPLTTHLHLIRQHKALYRVAIVIINLAIDKVGITAITNPCNLHSVR